MVTFAFEASGKPKAPTAQELVDADKKTAILAYSHGTLRDGRPYWAYIAVKPSKYPQFYALSKARKKINLNDYGAILASGFGTSPPPEVIEEMGKRYNFDEHYAQKLEIEAKKQQKEFHKKKEDKRIGDIVAMLKMKQKK